MVGNVMQWGVVGYYVVLCIIHNCDYTVMRVAYCCGSCTVKCDCTNVTRRAARLLREPIDERRAVGDLWFITDQ